MPFGEMTYACGKVEDPVLASRLNELCNLCYKLSKSIEIGATKDLGNFVLKRNFGVEGIGGDFVISVEKETVFHGYYTRRDVDKVQYMIEKKGKPEIDGKGSEQGFSWRYKDLRKKPRFHVLVYQNGGWEQELRDLVK